MGKSSVDRNRSDTLARARAQRSEAARIIIPEVVDVHRRESSLLDPEKFLLTYFADRYTIKFGAHHYKMIDTLVSRAKYGGRQAVAAPRGCGKSELFKGLLVYLVLAGLVRFPLLGAATAKLGRRLYQDFRTKIANNDLLLEDFPEVCHPVRALDGAPQRASKQHIDGKLTGIVWTAGDYLRIADVPGDANEYMRSKGWDKSPYGGVKLSYFGLDTAFRGFNIDGDRPDFVPIDDPETRESAKSYEQGEDREEIIDKDVAGLVSQEGNIAIAVLTTVQNCYCLSYRLTDPKIKPSFNGLRFGMVQKWPKAKEMWDNYIAFRHKDQSENGDEHGLTAVQYYLDNWDAMNEGVEMLSDHFVEIELDDGTQVVHSAIQQAYNKIADTSLEAYETEYQNSPPEATKDKTIELTAGKVANRLSGLYRGTLPEAEGVRVTMGIDLGDFQGHWCKVAWFGNATGVVIDYGILEISTMKQHMKGEAFELAMYKGLMEFCPNAMLENPPEFCLIDSGDGDHTQAVYRSVRDLAGMPFAPVKGWDSKRFRMPRITRKNSHEKRAFKECHAAKRSDDGVWLYHVNGEWWKHWLQQRFLTKTFGESGTFNDGSLSLFQPETAKAHMSFSHHMVAERRLERFEDGKGIVRKWVPLSINNHYLDAMAYACAAAGCLGIDVLQKIVEPRPAKAKPINKPFTTPDGRAFLATERR